MPAILEPDDLDAWLDPEHTDTDELGELLRSYEPDDLEAWQVNKTILNREANNPNAIKPIESEPSLFE